MFRCINKKTASLLLTFATAMGVSLCPAHRANSAAKSGIGYSKSEKADRINVESTFDQDVKDRRWSYEEMKKRRNRRKSNFFYTGLGFSVSGMAFQTQNLQGNTSVLSNGFLSANPLLGNTVRLGYEYSGTPFYFATEIFGMSLFSVNPSGTIGELSTGDSISLTSFGRGTIMVGLNIKPGFAFNNNKGAIYAIIGTAYQWVQGDYSQAGNPVQHFDMSGFGLNYGVGLKYTVYGFLMLFFEFTAIAPIKGGGAFGLDRTAFNPTTETAIPAIRSSENYSISIGLDFRV